MTSNLFAAAVAVSLAGAALAHGATFQISLDTSTLPGHPAGPFSLAFQLTDGSATNDGNTTVVLDQFTFGGGSANGLPSLIGSATGSLSTSVTLVDTMFFSYFVESFTPGNTLSFRLTANGGADAGGVPDLFALSILDGNGFELPTTGAFDAFLLSEWTTSNPPLAAYGSDNTRLPDVGLPAPDITRVGEVPEPSTLMLACGAAAILALRARRR